VLTLSHPLLHKVEVKLRADVDEVAACIEAMISGDPLPERTVIEGTASFRVCTC
jgi:hypothetical protein